jgi:2-phosphosulfolactate phosphatase
MKIDVIVSPAFLEEGDLKGSLCAVVDVLRATSTITAALVSGAAAFHPCLDIEEARKGAAMFGRELSLLGGEDRGQFIPGFDLGNSPLEYIDAKVVGGKDVFFYTSNGTGAIRRAYAECGRPVYIAALINLSAASSAIVETASAGKAEGIKILCSGRYGKTSAEDTFCSGLMVRMAANRLREFGVPPDLTDSATVAAGFAGANKGRGLDILASSEHGRFLQSLGFAPDLDFTARLDSYDAVPVFNGERVVLLNKDS